MPTQEERLTALEQKFADYRWEARQAIQSLNENATIALGLIQSISQESKQTALRMEMMKIRMDQLETKFDAHTALLNEHALVLSEHTARLNRIETRLDEHTARFDRIDTVLAQILARLPER